MIGDEETPIATVVLKADTVNLKPIWLFVERLLPVGSLILGHIPWGPQSWLARPSRLHTSLFSEMDADADIYEWNYRHCSPCDAQSQKSGTIFFGKLSLKSTLGRLNSGFNKIWTLDKFCHTIWKRERLEKDIHTPFRVFLHNLIKFV